MKTILLLISMFQILIIISLLKETTQNLKVNCLKFFHTFINKSFDFLILLKVKTEPDQMNNLRDIEPSKSFQRKRGISKIIETFIHFCLI